MIRFLADENFNGHVLRGLRRREPAIAIVRVQDVGLSQTADELILEWAAAEGRVLLTHDAATMERYAYDRVQLGRPMPGVIEVPNHLTFRQVIDDLLVIAGAARDDEYEGQVAHLPL
jgi:predicted nuclease of predicted toxin-antitoxin system